MAANPLSELRSAQSTVRETQHRVHDLWFRCFNLEPVEDQEHVGGGERNALVPVEEGVILGKTEPVLRGELRQVGVGLVCPHLVWTSQGGIEWARITHPEPTAMLAHLIGVQCFDDRSIQPDRLVHCYLASSRNALRYLAAVRLYAAIALSKVGS